MLLRSLILAAVLSGSFAGTLHAQEVTYLSPKIGTGANDNPIRPRRTPGEWDDCTELGTHFLCTGSAVPSGAGVIPLSTSAASRLSASEKTALASVTGKTVTVDTFQDLVSDIIDSRSVLIPPSPDNWQHLKIHGKEVWARPAPLKAFLPGAIKAVETALHLPLDLISVGVAWATTLATETFTASDGDLTGCEGRGCTHSWTEPLTSKDWTIVSNQANTATTAGGTGRNQSALATGDHEATATLAAFAASGGSSARCGVIMRKDSGTTDTFYRFVASYPAGVSTEYEMQRRAAGVTTSLATHTQDPAVSDVIKGRIQGNDYTGIVNGSTLIGPTTDASPITSANTYVGIFMNAGGSSSASCTLDGFIGNDYPIPSSSTRARNAIIY